MFSIGLFEILLLVAFSLTLGITAAVLSKKKGAGPLVAATIGVIVSILAIPLAALLALMAIEMRKQ